MKNISKLISRHITSNDTCFSFLFPSLLLIDLINNGQGRERKGRRKKFEKREKNELAYYFESKQEDIPRMSRKETERAMVGNFTVEWESAFSLEEEEEGREREKDGERRRSTLRRVPGWSRLPFEWFMDGLLLLVYSPLFKTITYCGERSDSLPSTFKTMILVIFSLSFLSFWRGEKKNLLEKREEKPIFRSLSSRRFLSRQFASSKTARRDKKEWVWKRGEWLVESFLPAMRCVTEGIGRRRKRLAEGCFERITTNSLAPEKWPTFDRRRNPRLLLFPRKFLKFRNDDRAINFFFFFWSKIGSKILETSFDLAIEMAASG